MTQSPIVNYNNVDFPLVDMIFYLEMRLIYMITVFCGMLSYIE